MPTVIPRYLQEETAETPLATVQTAIATPDTSPTPFTTGTNEPSPTPPPTETREPTPAPAPESTPLPSSEINSPIEMILGGEFYIQEIVRSREHRLGFVPPAEAPDGMRLIEQNGYSFLAPEGLPDEFLFLYSPESAIESLGLEYVPNNQRAEFLRQHIDNGRINILLAGLDYRPEYSGVSGGFRGRTDMPMLVSIDIQTGHMSLISFGRNIFSPEVSTFTGNDRANSQLSVMSWVYTRNGRTHNFDPAFSRYVIENACGCLIDAVWQFNYFAASELLEAHFPDGLLINVPQPLQDDTASLQVPLDLPAGWQTLTGPQLVSYARSRYTSANGDRDRQERQRQVLMAAIAHIAQQGRGYISNLDVGGALGFIHTTFSTSQNTLTTFENRRIDLNSGNREPAEEGYFQSFGLSPNTLLNHVNSATTQLTAPDHTAQLTRFFFSPVGQTWLESFQSGGIFTPYQITPQHTAQSWNSYAQYWGSSRAIILGELGLPSDPVPVAPTPDETEVAPILISEPETADFAPLNPDYEQETELPPFFGFGLETNTWDWLRSPTGPYPEFTLNNTQVDVVLDYVQTFGLLMPDTDFTDRHPQFEAALMLVRLGFENSEERTWFTQQVFNQQYGSASTFFTEWDAFTTASSDNPLLTSLLDPATEISSDIINEIQTEFETFTSNQSDNEEP